MDKRCFQGMKKARKQRVYELLDWCGKRDLNFNEHLFPIIAKSLEVP